MADRQVVLRVRPIPERLRYLAEYLQDEGEKSGVRLGVALGLRMIADELSAPIDGEAS